MPATIKNILLADDDADDVEMFQEAINEIDPNLSLIIAADGEKLLSLLAAVPHPDVIFLDLNMPCKTGKECLVEIRSNHNYNLIPVVIFSTSDSQAEIDFCMKEGATKYISKPTSYNGIVDMIQLLCSGNLYPDTF